MSCINLSAIRPHQTNQRTRLFHACKEHRRANWSTLQRSWLNHRCRSQILVISAAMDAAPNDIQGPIAMRFYIHDGLIAGVNHTSTVQGADAAGTMGHHPPIKLGQAVRKHADAGRRDPTHDFWTHGHLDGHLHNVMVIQKDKQGFAELLNINRPTEGAWSSNLSH